MKRIKIHVLHTGEVCIAPSLAFGGDNARLIKASGFFEKKSNRRWFPVSVYLIEHPKGRILVDCGWSRGMSPNGTFDKRAQIKSLGSRILFRVNQGRLGKGAAVDEQLSAMGISEWDLDYVLLTHLDCDHANGLHQVAGAKNILVSADELRFASMHTLFRYQRKWWKDIPLTPFQWNNGEGPFGKSYDLFGDGSIQLVHIPGHSDGLFAVKITNPEGRYVLLFSDGGYAEKSWKEMILSGIASDKEKQIRSLQWIREQSMDEKCLESLANHDPDVIPHNILL